MNEHIEQFKSNLFDSIFRLTFKIWAKVTVLYTIQFVVSSLIIFSILNYFIGIDVLSTFTSISNETDPIKIFNHLESLILVNTDPSTIFLGSSAIIVISMLILAWSYNAYFITAEQYIYMQKTSISHAFTHAFNKNIFKILGLSIYLFVSTFFLFSLVFPSFKLIGGLGLIIIPVLSILMTRFIIALPAILIGNMGIIESLHFSWNKITIGKASKILAIGILTVFALVLILIVIQLFMLPFAFLGGAGTVVSQLLSIAIQGFFCAFIVSCLIGLYFRYTEESFFN